MKVCHKRSFMRQLFGERPFSNLDRSIYLDAKDEKYEREHKQQSQEQFGELESVVLALVFVVTT